MPDGQASSQNEWITVKDYGWDRNHEIMHSSGKKRAENHYPTLYKRIVNYTKGVIDSLKPGDILDSSLHTPWNLPVFQDLIKAFEGDRTRASQFYGVVLLKLVPDKWEIRESTKSPGKQYRVVK